VDEHRAPVVLTAFKRPSDWLIWRSQHSHSKGLLLAASLLALSPAAALPRRAR